MRQIEICKICFNEGLEFFSTNRGMDLEGEGGGVVSNRNGYGGGVDY